MWYVDINKYLESITHDDVSLVVTYVMPSWYTTCQIGKMTDILWGKLSLWEPKLIEKCFCRLDIHIIDNA